MYIPGSFYKLSLFPATTQIDDYHVGYDSPKEAFTKAPKENLAYVTCVSGKWEETSKPDLLATIDLDPQSPTYSKVKPFLLH